MVDFTQEERLRIAQALADDMGGENTKAVDAAALGADPKQLFCQNWPLVPSFSLIVPAVRRFQVNTTFSSSQSLCNVSSTWTWFGMMT